MARYLLKTREYGEIPLVPGKHEHDLDVDECLMDPMVAGQLRTTQANSFQLKGYNIKNWWRHPVGLNFAMLAYMPIGCTFERIE